MIFHRKNDPCLVSVNFNDKLNSREEYMDQNLASTMAVVYNFKMYTSYMLKALGTIDCSK